MVRIAARLTFGQKKSNDSVSYFDTFRFTVFGRFFSASDIFFVDFFKLNIIFIIILILLINIMIDISKDLIVYMRALNPVHAENRKAFVQWLMSHQ